jgi:hypothetical protein
MEGLTSVSGNLVICMNPSLVSLSGLENIDPGSITDLTIVVNPALTYCQEQWLCDYLSNPNGTIFISDNDAGCKSIIQVASACGDSIPCLPYGTYSFNCQADIDNFQSAFPDCAALEGDVRINGYDITNLNGINVVTSIGGDLQFQDDYYLTSLTGLNNLTSVGGSLSIYANEALTSIAGVESLTSVGDDIQIAYNHSLTNLRGLDNIEADSISNLYIYYNPLLSACEVQSICDYLAAPGGTVEIHDNAPGCNSPEEVETACETISAEDFYPASSFDVYPNPVSGECAITFTLEEPATVRLEVYDRLGKMVATVKDEFMLPGEHHLTWNTARLPAGIYLCRLTAGNHSSTGKMVVVR